MFGGVWCGIFVWGVLFFVDSNAIRGQNLTNIIVSLVMTFIWQGGLLFLDTWTIVLALWANLRDLKNNPMFHESKGKHISVIMIIARTSTKRITFLVITLYKACEM